MRKPIEPPTDFGPYSFCETNRPHSHRLVGRNGLDIGTIRAIGQAQFILTAINNHTSLLAACKHALDRLESEHMNWGEIDTLRDAIAKATTS